MRRYLLPLLFVAGCTPAFAAPMGSLVGANSADCEAAPDGARQPFRHARSRVLANLGAPNHRGVDLIATEGDENQTVGGKLAYTSIDKDLEDEDVEVFACAAGGWRPIATARTDGDGRFTATLRGAARLAPGLTDLYLRVPGDGTGVRFLGYVARADERVIVSDIDGTITAAESAIYKTVMLGRDIGHQPGAPQAYAASGRTVVYVTARGDQLTEVTRRWLRAHGFPPGPVRLAKAVAVLPGKRTVAFKTATLRDLRVPIAAGVGNRASDVIAYRNAGLAASQIFINLPEFTGELAAELAAGNATGFDHYHELLALLR